MTTLCFTDTETTSVRFNRRAWDIGIIVREPGKADVEHQWFVAKDDLDMVNADLKSLNIGRFYDRHPEVAPDISDLGDVYSEPYVLRNVERLTRGAHLVGAVPWFDADVLGKRMRSHGILASWHYHLIDVEPMMLGWLYATGYGGLTLPWRSDDLSRAIGVEPASGEDRHTALGDARWVRDIYDAITTGKATL